MASSSLLCFSEALSFTPFECYIRPAMKKQKWVEVLLGLLPLVMGLELLAWVSVLPRMAHGGAEFRQVDVAGYMGRTGAAAKLYDYDYPLQLQNSLVAPAAAGLPFIRPAYQALVFAPLSLLSYRAAYFLWMAMNAALVALSAYLLRRRFRELAERWKPLPLIVLCSFFPLSLAILGGQDSILLLTLIAGALLALELKREFLAGCLIALGLFKFQIVLPIAFLFVVWKQWKFAKGFFSTGLTLVAISLALTGIPAIKTFFDSIARIRHPVHYEMMSNIHSLLFGIFGNSSFVTPLTLAASAAVLLGVARWSPVKSGPEALVIAIPAAALVSYYLFGHDWSVLVIPLLFAMNVGMTSWIDGWAALIMFLAPLVCIFDWHHAYWTTIPMVMLLIATAMVLRPSRQVSADT